jgi:hypothetical protein
MKETIAEYVDMVNVKTHDDAVERLNLLGCYVTWIFESYNIFHTPHNLQSSVSTHSGHRPAATWVNTTRYCKYSQVLLMMGENSAPKHVEPTWNNKLIYIVHFVSYFHSCITMHGFTNVNIPEQFNLQPYLLTYQQGYNVKLSCGYS